MTFDTHFRQQGSRAANALVNRMPAGAEVDAFAERHTQLSRSTAGNAVERMNEIDADARRLVTPQRLSWLERFFPTPAQQAQMVAEGKTAETESDFRLRALRVMRGVELQLLEDGLNAVRVQHGAILRGITAERTFAELHRVLDSFAASYDVFYSRASARVADAQDLPHEALRTDAYDGILDDLGTVRQMKTVLVERFAALVEREVTGAPHTD